jgi:hypothetical protein
MGIDARTFRARLRSIEAVKLRLFNGLFNKILQ